MKDKEKDEYLDRLVEEKKVVQVVLDMRLDYEGEPLERLYQGSLLSYSRLGLAILLVDGQSVFLPWLRISCICEVG